MANELGVVVVEVGVIGGGLLLVTVRFGDRPTDTVRLKGIHPGMCLVLSEWENLCTETPLENSQFKTICV